jgi:DNA (cytosine-5)-methyltransferase 1
MNYIELFSGCGGLSLGLESSGFELVMANELSPMAAETYAYNLLNEDLSKLCNSEKVFWLSSNYDRKDLNKRLRENPQTAIGNSKQHYSDLKNKNLSNADLKKSLLVGSIVDLNSLLMLDSKLLGQIQCGFGDGEIDLVSGGPPCQSFSMAGLREKDNHRNILPWEFAKFVGMVKPKIAVLENVSGILRAFNDRGKKYYAWHEVAKAFAKVGFIPLCLHVNAKNVGVAQNRPRFIMIGLREDVYESFSIYSKDINLLNALKISKLFFDEISNGNSPEVGTIRCFDIDKDRFLFVEGALKKLLSHSFGEYVSVEEAIDDLRSFDDIESEYVKRINKEIYNPYFLAQNKASNHDFRENGFKVRARFRLNQVINNLKSQDASILKSYIKYSSKNRLDSGLIERISNFWLLNVDGSVLKNGSHTQISQLISELRTHKHSQRALRANEPSSSVLGSPDDISHYYESKNMQRTLTVRELARIQSFPDWFEFRSKITTGGQCRKYEVPQYTQVGNAVPPLLGKALGDVCYEILKESRILSA